MTWFSTNISPIVMIAATVVLAIFTVVLATATRKLRKSTDRYADATEAMAKSTDLYTEVSEKALRMERLGYVHALFVHVSKAPYPDPVLLAIIDLDNVPESEEPVVRAKFKKKLAEVYRQMTQAMLDDI